MPRQRSVLEDSESNMPDQVVSAVEYGMEQTKKLCKEILPLCDPELKREMEEKLTERFKKLIRAQLVYEESSKIVGQVVDEIENGDGTRDIIAACDSIQTESQRRIEQFQTGISENMVTRNPAFQAFKKELDGLVEEQDTESEASEGESPAPSRKKRGGKSAFDPEPEEMDTEGEDEGSSEEGEGIVNEILPSVDPITKGPLKDPVRNKYCGHIYGRATITEYIKSRKTKCPVGGCTNPKYVLPGHLVEDEETTENVRKARGRKRGKK